MREHAPGVMELRFAELIWANEPIGSGELVHLAAETFGWKKTTTYTMLRRLCERGLFQNEGGLVRALMSEAELRAVQSERFVEDAFGGSLPRFVAAFASRRPLDEADIAELRQLIEESEART